MRTLVNKVLSAALPFHLLLWSSMLVSEGFLALVRKA
jgi:hypothetical protein